MLTALLIFGYFVLAFATYTYTLAIDRALDERGEFDPVILTIALVWPIGLPFCLVFSFVTFACPRLHRAARWLAGFRS